MWGLDRPPQRARGSRRSQDQVADTASLQGNRSPTAAAQGPGHRPWCCHKRDAVSGPVPRAHLRQQGPPHPSPEPPQPPPALLGARPRGSALGPSRGQQPRPRPSRGPGPHGCLSPEMSSPLSLRWVENQNCFLNWYFPVERTSYAFFTCVIELPNVFIFEKT